MAIAEQFAGLDMEQLIGSPLRAAAGASKQLADSTAEFINRVGFDETGKLRTVAFAYQKHSVNEDGTSNLDEMKVDLPMLAIVPIPNLQVDEVNILFDMEVKQSEKQESSRDMSGTMSGTMNLGIIKVSVTGSVSAHQSNTRSSDNSAKYHVDVRATNHGTPEGLARVLDMMAANVAPSLVSASLKEGYGPERSEQAKVKAERLKALRQEISQIENRLQAAENGFDNYINQIKKLAENQKNAYQVKLLGMMNKLDKDNEKDQTKAEDYTKAMDEVNLSWDNFYSQAGDMIKLVADSGTEKGKVAALFSLKAVSEDGKVEEYGSTGNYYSAIAGVQAKAVDSQNNIGAIEKELFEKKAEYSDAVAGRSTAALTEKQQPEEK